MSDPKYAQFSNEELYVQYSENKDVSIRNELMVRNRPLVTYILNKYYSTGRIPDEVREELLQEGSIGLLNAIQGFDHTLGFKFSTYGCVPPTTQILTKRGWKYHNELTKDDETIGYNNGKSEWTKIKGVNVYDDAPLVRFGDSLWSAVCTPQHKWLISENDKTSLKPLTSWPESKSFEWPKKGKSGYKRPDVHLVTSAPFVGGNSPLTPDEASVLAWILSDGSLYGDWRNGNPTGAVIVQSKKKFANDIRELLQKLNAYCSDAKRKDSNCLSFNVKASVFREIWSKSKLREQSLSSLVLDLSPESRKAWFKTWRDAEGTKNKRLITQSNGYKMDALELCTFLEGKHGVHVTKKTEKCSYVSWHSKPRTPRRCVVTPLGRGEVWCPKTDLGSWTARTEDGFIFLTGNTWWIKQAINNYLINVNPIIRVPSHIKAAQNKLLKKLRLTKKDLYDISDIDPKDYELTEKMLKSIGSAVRSKHVDSMDKPIKNQEEGSKATLQDIIPDENTECDRNHDRELVIIAMKNALKALPEKRRLILLLRYDVIKNIPKINDVKTVIKKKKGLSKS